MPLAAFGIQLVQERFFEHPYLEALVIAIVLGTAIRTAWAPGPRWEAGIAFCAKQLLEIAVTLLGASISFALIAASGVALLSAIVGTVAVMLAASYGIARLLGLPVRLSILIACGNSICGNSAIAAIAPIIGAKGDEIASVDLVHGHPRRARRARLAAVDSVIRAFRRPSTVLLQA